MCVIASLCLPASAQKETAFIIIKTNYFNLLKLQFMKHALLKLILLVSVILCFGTTKLSAQPVPQCNYQVGNSMNCTVDMTVQFYVGGVLCNTVPYSGVAANTIVYPTCH